MYLKKARLIIFISGLFLLVDRLLKWQVLNDWSQPYLLNRFFGWQPFFNKGIAFGLAIPYQITLIFSLPIIFLVLYLLTREWKKGNLLLISAWSLIFAGAISNFFDRAVYNHVVDYFLIVTAVINISDIIIVVGLVFYFLSMRPTKTNSLTNS